MSNIPRFVKEYANYRKRKIISDPVMSDQYKQKGISNIDTAVRCLEKGLITVDETIRMILTALK